VAGQYDRLGRDLVDGQTGREVGVDEPDVDADDRGA
jgi:hypothetical protein